MSDYYTSEEYYAKKDAAIKKALEAQKQRQEDFENKTLKDREEDFVEGLASTEGQEEYILTPEDKKRFEALQNEYTTTTPVVKSGLSESPPLSPPPDVSTTQAEQEQILEAAYEETIKTETSFNYNPIQLNATQEKTLGLKEEISLLVKQIRELEVKKTRTKDKRVLDEITKYIKDYEAEIDIIEKRLDKLVVTENIITSTPSPPGYHYMPDGSLMSDAEHEALNKIRGCTPNNLKVLGVTEAEEKIIQNIEFDTSDINQDGETRSFTINATNGSVFTLEITDNDNKYYNFFTNAFQTARASIKNQVVAGNYEFSVTFPSISDASAKKYDIHVLSVGDTVHSVYERIDFEDGSIDLNSSIGSKSVLLRKVLYQTASKTLDYVLSATTPNNATNFTSPAATSDKTFVDSAKAVMGKTSAFEVSYTAQDTRAFQISRQPVDLDVFVKVTRTIGSAAVPIEGEDTSSSTYYRWPLNNIDGLDEGMQLAAGTNVTADSAIKYYEEVVTSAANTRCARDVVAKRVEALDTLKAPPTLARDITAKGVLVKTQTGNVVFDKQQADALKDDTVTFLAYGPEDIEKLTGWRIEFNNLKAELAAVTTTTTSAVSGSTSIPVASGDGIVDNVSVMSGIGVNAAAGNPTVTAIGSYSGSTATLTVGSAQTLEDGITLTFTGAGTALTISGNIIFRKEGKTYGSGYEMPGWDGKFYFDLEKFITATNETS